MLTLALCVIPLTLWLRLLVRGPRLHHNPTRVSEPPPETDRETDSAARG